MSLFKVEKDTNFEGPHQATDVIEGGVPAAEADAAMIMIHGRGASAQSIIQLAGEFDVHKKLTLRAPQAQGFTWYPNSFLQPSEKNEPGISSGLQKIFDIIQSLKEEGISEEDIFILGFSQGACLASEFVARHPQKYGGLIALSGGLIGHGNTVNPNDYSGNLDDTPVFLGCSDIDPHIPKERVNETEEVLKKLNGHVTKKLYEGMGHHVNQDEIKHINELING